MKTSRSHAQLRRPRSQSFQAAGYPSIHRSIIVRQQRTVEGRLNDSREILVLPAFDGVSIQTAKCFPPPPAFDLGPGPSARVNGRYGLSASVDITFRFAPHKTPLLDHCSDPSCVVNILDWVCFEKY